MLVVIGCCNEHVVYEQSVKVVTFLMSLQRYRSTTMLSLAVDDVSLAVAELL